jgi:hypothetical protein
MILEKFALTRGNLMRNNSPHFITIPKHGWQERWKDLLRGKP